MILIMTGCDKASVVETYEAPDSEKSSEDYSLQVNKEEVFCYEARVYDTRYTEGIYYGENGLPYSTVTFAYFDFSGRVKVTIKVNHDIKSAIVRPLSGGIEPEVHNNTIEFYIDKPGSFTIEPDGSDQRVFHLFANPLMARPDQSDENLVYYGPGEHVVNTIELTDNQTLFIDGGAVVYFDAFENDTVYRIETRNNDIELKRFDHAIEAINAKNIRITGRGILDFSRIAEKYGRKNPIHINNCENVLIEGIIMRCATCWHATLYRSSHVTVDNIKEISFGFNSDGINVVLSQDVHIKNSFMRQRDDGIIMKSMDIGNTDAFITEVPQHFTSTSDVLVEDCVIWSDWGYALGVTYETRMPVENITFRNCDIIHATHATELQGVIGILVADSSSVSEVNFENITIERSLKPIIKLDQRVTKWTVNPDLGEIHDIRFSGIRYLEGDSQPVIFNGIQGKGGIKNIYLEKLNFLGKDINDLNDWEFRINEFVEEVHLTE
jgi:hypothetical protein